MLTWLSSDGESMSGQCWLTVCYAGPVFTRRWFNVSCFVSFIQAHTLVTAASRAVGQRYRCWASINPTLAQCFVLAMLSYYWTGKILGHRTLRLNHYVNVRQCQWWEADGSLYAYDQTCQHQGLAYWYRDAPPYMHQAFSQF